MPGRQMKKRFHFQHAHYDDYDDSRLRPGRNTPAIAASTQRTPCFTARFLLLLDDVRPHLSAAY